jgi:hypothetical protein
VRRATRDPSSEVSPCPSPRPGALTTPGLLARAPRAWRVVSNACRTARLPHCARLLVTPSSRGTTAQSAPPRDHAGASPDPRARLGASPTAGRPPRSARGPPAGAILPESSPAQLVANLAASPSRQTLTVDQVEVVVRHRPSRPSEGQAAAWRHQPRRRVTNGGPYPRRHPAENHRPSPLDLRRSRPARMPSVDRWPEP